MIYNRFVKTDAEAAWYLELAYNLDRARKNLGMSKYRLARLSGVHASCISNYANSKALLTDTNQLCAMAKAIGVEATSLFPKWAPLPQPTSPSEIARAILCLDS